jgi:hypothetical protein
MKDCTCEDWKKNKDTNVILELQKRNINNCPYCGKKLIEENGGNIEEQQLILG